MISTPDNVYVGFDMTDFDPIPLLPEVHSAIGGVRVPVSRVSHPNDFDDWPLGVSVVVKGGIDKEFVTGPIDRQPSPVIAQVPLQLEVEIHWVGLI